MIEVLFNSLPGALLAASAVTLISARSKKVGLLPAVFLLGALFIGVAVAVPAVLFDHLIQLDLSWVSPFSFALALDRLSAFFLFLICAVAIPVVVYSTSYVARHYSAARQRWLWALLPLFLFSLVLVVTADTAFAFLFGWELMTLFSAALVMVDGCEGERRRNIFIYLLMMHVGAAAVFGAFLGFLPNAAALDFGSLRASAPLLTSTARSAIFLLAFVGFGVKAGIVPLHLWLPEGASHRAQPSFIADVRRHAEDGRVRIHSICLRSPRQCHGLARTGVVGATWCWRAGALSALLGVLYAISRTRSEAAACLSQRGEHRHHLYGSRRGHDFYRRACFGMGSARADGRAASLRSTMLCSKACLFLGAGAIVGRHPHSGSRKAGRIAQADARNGNGLPHCLLLDYWFAAVQRICKRMADLP